MKKLLLILIFFTACVADIWPIWIVPVDPHPQEENVAVDAPVLFELHSQYLIDADTVSTYCYYWSEIEGEDTMRRVEKVEIEGYTTTSIDDYDMFCSFRHPNDDFPEGTKMIFVVEAGITNYNYEILEQDFIWSFYTEGGGVDIELLSWGEIKTLP